jgi:hypothetical protein
VKDHSGRNEVNRTTQANKPEETLLQEWTLVETQTKQLPWKTRMQHLREALHIT